MGKGGECEGKGDREQNIPVLPVTPNLAQQSICVDMLCLSLGEGRDGLRLIDEH